MLLLIRIINSINHSPQLAHPNDPITDDRQQLPASIDLGHTHTDEHTDTALDTYTDTDTFVYLLLISSSWHFTNVRVVLVSLGCRCGFRFSDF